VLKQHNAVTAIHGAVSAFSCGIAGWRVYMAMLARHFSNIIARLVTLTFFSCHVSRFFRDSLKQPGFQILRTSNDYRQRNNEKAKCHIFP